MAWILIIVGGVFIVGAAVALMYYYERTSAL